MLRCLAILVMAVPASATGSAKTDLVQRRSVEIRSDNLDLSREAGARKMLARRDSASSPVIGQYRHIIGPPSFRIGADRAL